jgi:putative redox protein
MMAGRPDGGIHGGQTMSTQATWRAADGVTACAMSFDPSVVNGGFPVDLDPEAGGGPHPSPHDILDSALAACTALTLQLYARRKAMALQDVQVTVSHRTEAGVYRMARQITLTGPLSDDERSALLRVAQACPVHKTLSGEIQIETVLDAR